MADQVQNDIISKEKATDLNQFVMRSECRSRKMGIRKTADLTEVWVKARPGVRRQTAGEAIRKPQALFHGLCTFL